MTQLFANKPVHPYFPRVTDWLAYTVSFSHSNLKYFKSILRHSNNIFPPSYVKTCFKLIFFLPRALKHFPKLKTTNKHSFSTMNYEALGFPLHRGFVGARFRNLAKHTNKKYRRNKPLGTLSFPVNKIKASIKKK